MRSAGCVTAICAMTSPDCRRERAATTPPLAVSFNPSDTARRVTCNAGDRPKRIPVVSAMPNVKANAGQASTS